MAPRITTDALTRYLDGELAIDQFRDAANNGLQVANSGSVKRVCCGVDASMEFFEAAQTRGANFLICHHGISWGDSLKRITELNYRRIQFLMKHDMALYAAHLPLDAHARYGNNALICKALQLKRIRGFGIYDGSVIGFAGELAKPQRFTTFTKRVENVMGQSCRIMPFGPQTVRSVGVVSGGAASEVDQAAAAGLDVYLTGEPKLSAYSQAQELGINVLFGGHYATEVFGVRKLADVVRRRFGVAAEFIGFSNPF
ncbi:MAG: Nif3-like dinuclear metal center hexameric protein [Verrucomicrobia bacterium]|nr:Nif3-like dinuclear metal center hexameric protein [Verrucomicrobiota bacterium]